MKPRIDKKHTSILIVLCWAAYTIAYFGRLNYNASLVEIIDALGATKEQAGLVSSLFFFSYAAGQLVHGILSKRYNTKYSVAVALVASSAFNFLMPFVKSIAIMKYVWLLNGAFQSILWSSLIKTISQYVDESGKPKAVLAMSTTVAVGTFASYGTAALLSHLKINYSAIFYAASAAMLAVAVIWFLGMGKIEKFEKTDVTDAGGTRQKLKLSPSMAVFAGALVLSAIANGFLKDGVTTWVPSVLKENFGVSPSISIIVTLALPMLSIFGARIVTALHPKIKNPHALDGIFYVASTLFIGVIILTIGLKSAPLTLGLFALVACMMSAINNVITSVVPLYAHTSLPAGLLAGLLNTFCYVGSTLAITLLGSIADNSGWNAVFNCIFWFSIAATVVCIAAVISERGKKSYEF